MITKCSADQVEKVFKHQRVDHLLKGELWLGEGVFNAAQLKNHLKGHIELTNRIGMDLLVLPVSTPDISFQNTDYRRFDLDDIQRARDMTDLFLAIIVDGPFQRLVDKHGLVPLIGELNESRSNALRLINEESIVVKDLVDHCLDLKVRAVVIADDIAYDQATYLSPADLKELLGSFYSEIVTGIHSNGGYSLFHSCGNITGMLPHLIAFGFDGLAACQSECVDLDLLKESHGAKLTILAGIDANSLEAGILSELQRREFCKRIVALAQGGGFILGSSCGLYTRKALQTLPELYRLADQCLRNDGKSASFG